MYRKVDLEVEMFPVCFLYPRLNTTRKRCGATTYYGGTKLSNALFALWADATLFLELSD